MSGFKPKLLSTLADKSSDNVSALVNKGLALDSSGNHAQAIQYYDMALAIDPNDVDALYNKGNALDSLGNHTEAISYYNKVLDIDPNDSDALNNKGDALAHLRLPITTKNRNITFQFFQRKALIFLYLRNYRHW